MAALKEMKWMFREAKTYRVCGTGYWRKRATQDKRREQERREGEGTGQDRESRGKEGKVLWRSAEGFP